MPRIPTVNPQVRLSISNQPNMPASFGSAPGRAIQGLGSAIGGLAGEFGGDGKPNEEQEFQNKLNLLKWQNTLRENQGIAESSYNVDVDDPNAWQQKQNTDFERRAKELRNMYVPSNNRSRYAMELELERARGTYRGRNQEFATQQRQARLVNKTSRAITGEWSKLDPADPNFAQNFAAVQQGIGAIIDKMPGVNDRVKDGLRKEAAQLALKTVERLQGPQRLPFLKQIQERMLKVSPAEQESGRAKPVPISSSQKSRLEGVKPDVVSRLEQVQSLLGKELPINSGYRDPAHNSRVGGARKSQHISRNAIDVDVSGLSKEERLKLIEIASAQGFAGIGVYNNAIHFDIGSRRSWGPDYKSGSVPGWARSAISQHLKGQFKGAGLRGASEQSGPDFRGRGGPAAVRYNNPGAQWPGPSSKKFGAVETVTLNDKQRNKIAVFPTAVHGAAAHFDLLNRRYTGMTLSALVTKWGGGNSPGAYASNVAGKVGISENTVITKEMMADPEFAIPFAKAMASHEAGKSYPLSDDQWNAGFGMFRGEPGASASSSGPSIKSSFDRVMAEVITKVMPDLEKRHRTMLIKQIDSLRDNAAKGYALPADQIGALKSVIEGSGDPEMVAAYNGAVSYARLTSTLKAQSPAANEAYLNNLRSAIQKNQPTPDQVKQLEEVERFVSAQKSEIKDDALTWSNRAGVVTIQPLNLKSAESLQLRLRNAEITSQKFGIPAQYFTKIEREALSKGLDDGSIPIAGLAKGLTDVWGQTTARQALAELSDQSPEAALLGGHMVTIGVTPVAKEAAEGLQLSKEQGFKSMAPSLSEARSTFDDITGEAFAYLPRAGDNLRALANAAYEARARRKGLKSGKDADLEEYGKIVSELLGERTISRQKYGGVTTLSTGGAWGDGQWEKKYTVVAPHNVRQDGFDDLVSLIKVEDFGDNPPRFGSGRAVTQAELMGARFVTVGTGKYRLGKQVDDDVVFYQDAKGAPFVFEFKTVEPRLRLVRPDLFVE